MPRLYQFPSLDDRQRIHDLIALYAQAQITRNTMMRQIAAIIERYNIQRMPVFGYSVRILQYYDDLPIISIEGAQITDTCPCCGSSTEHARYLRTEAEYFDREYDEVSMTCLECGCVYLSHQPNGRRVNKNGRVLQ